MWPTSIYISIVFSLSCSCLEATREDIYDTWSVVNEEREHGQPIFQKVASSIHMVTRISRSITTSILIRIWLPYDQ